MNHDRQPATFANYSSQCLLHYESLDLTIGFFLVPSLGTSPSFPKMQVLVICVLKLSSEVIHHFYQGLKFCCPSHRPKGCTLFLLAANLSHMSSSTRKKTFSLKVTLYFIAYVNETRGIDFLEFLQDLWNRPQKIPTVCPLRNINPLPEFPIPLFYFTIIKDHFRNKSPPNLPLHL